MAANLNELMREKASREFTTLFWAYYNPERHDLRYVNAGHLPPLLVVSTSGEVRRLETGGPVLGLLPKAVYQEECVRLNGEQTLIIYSDGLAEATSPIGEDFGESRLLSVVRASSRQTACTVLRRVMDEAIRFVEGGEFHDDLTVLVAKLVQTESKGRRI
jgi:phosphoserine phosphatase RsbU/P